MALFVSRKGEPQPEQDIETREHGKPYRQHEHSHDDKNRADDEIREPMALGARHLLTPKAAAYSLASSFE